MASLAALRREIAIVSKALSPDADLPEKHIISFMDPDDPQTRVIREIKDSDYPGFKVIHHIIRFVAPDNPAVEYGAE